MITDKEINAEISDLTALKELVETYEEIAISRMRKIRNAVLSTRDFANGLAQIFVELTSSYRAQVQELIKEKGLKNVKLTAAQTSILNHNGKTVSVFLSANTGLYGDIVQNTFNLFINSIKNTPTDLVILGRLGKKLFDEQGPKIPATFIDFPDEGVDREKVRALLDLLLKYEKVLVYYGQFENVIKQEPTVADLYGEEITPTTGSNSTQSRYVFEPTLETILEFFETEIFTSIFEQTVQESNLAKYASRMISLDSATENIGRRMKNVEFQKRLTKHRIMNRKQLDSLTGFSLWKVT